MRKIKANFYPVIPILFILDLSVCRVNRTVRLRNISTKSLNLRLQLHSVSKGYELLEQGIVVLKPEESHLVHIIFQPPSGAFFQNYLDIRVLNAEHINYSIPLLGSGGVAALRVLTQSGLTMLRDGSFVLTTQGVTNINFDVENKGPSILTVSPQSLLFL
uniref:WHy domain-containing protein n=1 Tax=Onchocerca flexuosa TaxID=387005 RepID=A0A183HP54_9BILA